jgi:hypothetical protein
MATVVGNFYAFDCYPTCCSDVSDCSDCITSSSCGALNTCNEGYCGTCYASAYDIAYANVSAYCDQSTSCPIPRIPCGTLGTLFDSDTGLSLDYVEVADCGPNSTAVCCLGFIGCMTFGAWDSIADPSYGPNYCDYGY